MGAKEWESGQLVGKSGWVEFGNVGLAAVMFGVTAAALAVAGFGHPAVVAALCVDVRGDILVAFQAKTGLSPAAGAIVANGAVILESGVRL
jgi:hypothetical protein